MSERSKFIKGTVILFCANAFSKILGAIYKIPLTYILKEEGMAVYQTAFTVYMMFLTFVTSGFPFAATKLLAEYHAVGKDDRVRPVVNSVGIILFIIGLVMSAIMYIFADKFAISMREVNAGGAIRVISLSVLFVSVGGIIKSSNEARAELLPTAFSQVFESAIKLSLGLFFAFHMSKFSVFKAAEGAVAAVTLGELIATIFLMCVWRIKVRKLRNGFSQKSELRTIFSLAIPLLLTGVAGSFLSMAEVSAIRSALSSLKFNEDTATAFLSKYSQYTNVFDDLLSTLTLSSDGVRKIFGAYSGYAQAIFNLPAGIIATVTAAATPMFANALMRKKPNSITDATERVLSLIMILSVPSSVIMFFYPEELLYLLFKNHFSADMLRTLAPSLIFLCTNNMLIALLHLSGRIFEPFVAILSCLTLRIILSSILIRMPGINILGAGIAAVISSIFLYFILMFQMKKNFKCIPNFLKISYIPLASSAVMIGFMHPAKAYLYRYFSTNLSFIITAIIGVVIYSLTLFLLIEYNKRVQS